MKTRTKSYIITAFCLGVIACTAGGLVGQLNKAEAEGLSNFYISGAGVRVNAEDGQNGVRFHTLMSESDYAALVDG